jgi:hypothetical protein
MIQATRPGNELGQPGTGVHARLSGLHLSELVQLRRVAQLRYSSLVGGRARDDKVSWAPSLTAAKGDAAGHCTKVATDVYLVFFGVQRHVETGGSGNGFADTVTLAVP